MTTPMWMNPQRGDWYSSLTWQGEESEQQSRQNTSKVWWGEGMWVFPGAREMPQETVSWKDCEGS